MLALDQSLQQIANAPVIDEQREASTGLSSTGAALPITGTILALFDQLDQLNVPEEPDEPELNPENDENNAQQRRPRNVRYEYDLEETFNDSAACEEYIQRENCWKVHTTISQTDGVKTIYWCNRVKWRGQRCLAEIYTLSDRFPGDEAAVLYRRKQDHTCETAENRVIKLSDEIKAGIEKYVGMRLTPKPMIQQLRKELPNDPAEKKQILAYYKKYRKELYGKSNTSVEDMVDFCLQNSDIPDDIDKAFVLSYERSTLDDLNEEIGDKVQSLEKAFETNEPTVSGASAVAGTSAAARTSSVLETSEEQFDEPWIRYIVTTKRFLINSVTSKNICVDATKKIIVQRYPVLVFGTTDMDSTQRFHLIAAMVSKQERAADIEFGFKAIQMGMDRVLNQLYAPKILMRDAALAIHNAFISVFGNDTKSLMCVAHVARALDRRPVESHVKKDDIKKDFSLLRLAYSKEVFDVGCQLFLTKWRKFSPNFAKYFEDTWMRQNSEWYNGACYRMVSTNNGIENWNGNLKKYHTQWKITGLNQFKIDLMGIVAKESAEYGKDRPPFKKDVTISKNMMKEGFLLSKNKSIVRIKGADGKGRCYIRKGESKEPLTTDDVEQFVNAVYTTFDEFAAHFLDIYVVTFEMEVATWKETASCTCPSFADYFICKHVMCMVYTLRLEKYQPEQQLAPNNAPGRPRKATAALVID